jgi:SNF2 family DNA or RNA helicase
MKFTEREWQKLIKNFVLDHNRCNIWADMGSGKTSATLSALEILMLCGSSFFPALILAPLRVARDVWPAEIRKWDHLNYLRISPIIGDAADRRRALHRDADIYAINYDNIPWLIEQCKDEWKFKIVIADESTKLKGYRSRQGTKRSHALATIARKTHRWVNLTGTPAPNGLKDLWGQNWFLDFGDRLGRTWTDYSTNYFDQDRYTNTLTPKKEAQDQIQKKLADITLTVQMKDFIDLREPVYNQIDITLPADRMREYRKLERDMFVTLQNEVELTAMSAAAKTTKCLQFAAGAAYTAPGQWTEIHNTKLDALEEIVEETAGANLLVAYWWKHDAARILKRFPQARLLRTKKDVDDWNAGRIAMALAHPQSAGHGLSLQDGGHHIVYFSDWWNFETHAQIMERIGPTRQMQSGYDRPVYIHNIVVKNTLDEEVVLRHSSKADTQQILMDAMKRRIE